MNNNIEISESLMVPFDLEELRINTQIDEGIQGFCERIPEDCFDTHVGTVESLKGKLRDSIVRILYIQSQIKSLPLNIENYEQCMNRWEENVSLQLVSSGDAHESIDCTPGDSMELCGLVFPCVDTTNGKLYVTDEPIYIDITWNPRSKCHEICAYLSDKMGGEITDRVTIYPSLEKIVNFMEEMIIDYGSNLIDCLENSVISFNYGYQNVEIKMPLVDI